MQNPNEGTAVPNRLNASVDVLCFSHLRWDFVFQRPQHLMTRFARTHRVFFIEEPVKAEDKDRLTISPKSKTLFVVVPHLKDPGSPEAPVALRNMISGLLDDFEIDNYIEWFYSPMMVELASDLEPLATVFDCMDELSAFKDAPLALRENEALLFERADVVFTGGASLFESKKTSHANVNLFPSSIDAEHFARALDAEPSPDVTAIKGPRIGFVGVIDERLDTDLLKRAAELRPDWSFVMVGPVVKINESDLPTLANIHYLGSRQYEELPEYMAGFDVAMMPFAINEATRFISPTKTPEYLAAGLPVVSSPIRDVVDPYGKIGLVHIASNAEEFVASIETALAQDTEQHRRAAVKFLSTMSWDATFHEMTELISKEMAKSGLARARSAGHVP